MKTRILFFILFAMCTVTLPAQDTLKFWKKTSEIGLSFNQVSLTNWAAGGENSISGRGYFNFNAIYSKNKSKWDNGISIAYGILKQGNQGLRKSDDKIDLSSKYGYQASKYWYYSALLNFKSQFANGYDYQVSDTTKISSLFAPAYILLGIGMDYKPNDYFSVLLAPASARLTLVIDEELADKGSFGVDPAVYDANGQLISHGKKTKFEMGATVKVYYKKEIMKNISLQAKLQLFSDYLHNPQNIDVDAETMFLMKINDFISTTLTLNLLYDDDIMITDKNGNTGPRTQFKEVFGLGFTYRF